MTSWIILAITAYLLSAVAFVVDKYLLALPIPKPFTYAVWVAVLSTPVVLLIPFFNIFIPGITYFLISFASGCAFFIGLILLYTAVRKSDISVASTQVGVATAIFTYIISVPVLQGTLPDGSLTALALLIVGTALLGKVGKGIIWQAIGAGIMLASSFVLLKWTFGAGDFVNGIFWTRIGFIGAALISLIGSKKARSEVKALAKGTKKSSKLIFTVNKVIAATAFVILYYAISLGDVVIVNAMLGVQFLFVFLIAMAIRKKFPFVEEKTDRATVITKALGILFVLVGFLSII